MSKYSDFVIFARFCRENNIPEVDGAEVCKLANLSFKQNERYHNTGKHNKAYYNKLEVLANSLGFEVRETGLQPSLFKDGRYIEIPSL